MKLNLIPFHLLQADKDKEDISEAKSSAHQDDILAVCKLHGFHGMPSVENQLQALDKEYHQLKDQGQFSKSDYVQTLYLWLSKHAAKVTLFHFYNSKNPQVLLR